MLKEGRTLTKISDYNCERPKKSAHKGRGQQEKPQRKRQASESESDDNLGSKNKLDNSSFTQ